MENNNNNRKFYSVNQFYELIGNGVISKSYIYQKIRKGEIPVTYFGTKPLIPVSWVDNFLSSSKAM